MTEATGYRERIPLIGFCLLASVLSFPFIYSAIGVAVATLGAICFLGPALFRNFSQRKLLWVWTALYVWHACSWFWSLDKGQANSDLGTKLSMLLLPVAIGSSGLLSRRNLQKVVFAFISGLTVVACWCMWQSWQRYQISHDANTLFYHQLVQGLDANAVYVGWYTITALFFILLEPVEISFFRNGFVRLLFIVVLLPFFLLLTARTLLLFFLLVGIPVALLHSFRRRVSRSSRLLIRTTAFLMVALSVVAFRTPSIQARFQELKKSKPELSFLPHYQGEDREFGNLNVRLFLWRVGISSLTATPQVLLAGTGIGDAHLVINERIRQLGIAPMEEQAANRHAFYDINLHNSFLQIALMTGLIGLVLLLTVVFAPFANAIRRFKTHPFDLVFYLSSVVFMMQEAVFQTQAGIIFYLTFWCLLADYGYRNRIPAQ
ncbi:MAG: hypothetical protein EOP52_01580 [Sphingobacteriales bacterium]|nr:MAG: hypothetical protein EOP52_01580 [Sphingobacteriales bacterium]